MISPTVGRIVWFHITKEQIEYYATIDDARRSIALLSDQPMAAIVTHVWSGYCVNLSVSDHNGGQFAFTSVKLLQDDEPSPGAGMWAEWMPFQKGQAAKTEALEKTLAA